MKAIKRKDLTGLRFGYITVIRYTRTVRVNKWRYNTYWLCRDDFGFEKELTSAVLLSGQARSCGGLRKTSKKEKHHRWKGCGDLYMGQFYNIRHGAKVRNLPFEITIEDAWQLFLKQNKKCALTGLDIKLSTGNLDKETTASLDRIDSTKGYTLENIQWVHTDINKMKMEFPQKYFIEMCKLVSSRNTGLSCNI